MNATPAPCLSFVALGSNLNNPEQQVLSGIAALKKLGNTQLLVRSSLYQSAAIGPGAQANYINAVVKLSTLLTPLQLLDALQLIESQHGRTRNIRWESRTLDLDILLYNNERIASSRLSIPHPEMLKRNFVLYPLYEIEPNLVLPNGSSLTKQLQQSSAADLTKLPSRSALAGSTLADSH